MYDINFFINNFHLLNLLLFHVVNSVILLFIVIDFIILNHNLIHILYLDIMNTLLIWNIHFFYIFLYYYYYINLVT